MTASNCASARRVETGGALGRGLGFELRPCVGDLRHALGDRGVVLCGVARGRELRLGLLPAGRIAPGRLVLSRLALLLPGRRPRTRAGAAKSRLRDRRRGRRPESVGWRFDRARWSSFRGESLGQTTGARRAPTRGAPFPGSTHRPTRSSFHKREARGRRILEPCKHAVFRCARLRIERRPQRTPLAVTFHGALRGTAKISAESAGPLPAAAKSSGAGGWKCCGTSLACSLHFEREPEPRSSRKSIRQRHEIYS